MQLRKRVSCTSGRVHFEKGTTFSVTGILLKIIFISQYEDGLDE